MNTPPHSDSPFWPHYDYVQGVINKSCPNNIAQEHVQTVYVRLLDKSYPADANFRQLFVSSAKRECIAKCIRRKRPINESTLGVDIASLSTVAESDPLAALCLLEDVEKLKQSKPALQLAHPRCFECLIRKFYFGLSYIEIAAELDVSKRTVQNDVQFALRFLRKQLGSE